MCNIITFEGVNSDVFTSITILYKDLSNVTHGATVANCVVKLPIFLKHLLKFS